MSVTRAEKIAFILRWRFQKPHVAYILGNSVTRQNMSRHPHNLPNKEQTAAITALKRRLDNRSDRSLSLIYWRCMRYPRRLTPRNERSPFEWPNAAPDFSYWVKLVQWNIADGLLLINRCDPNKFDLDGIFQHARISHRAQKVKDDELIARSAHKAGQLSRNLPPALFVQWARNSGLYVEPALRMALKAAGLTVEAQQQEIALMDARSLSPYLRLAIAATQALQPSATNKVTTRKIGAWLTDESNWPEDVKRELVGPLSGNDKKGLATMIRWPGQKGGGAEPTNAKKNIDTFFTFYINSLPKR
ncbi:MAG: hypothetical protein AAGF20_09840 [Pseudomonadota bacterium]